MCCIKLMSWFPVESGFKEHQSSLFVTSFISIKDILAGPTLIFTGPQAPLYLNIFKVMEQL